MRRKKQKALREAKSDKKSKQQKGKANNKTSGKSF